VVDAVEQVQDHQREAGQQPSAVACQHPSAYPAKMALGVCHRLLTVPVPFGVTSKHYAILLLIV
jgi:hypothetical protein